MVRGDRGANKNPTLGRAGVREGIITLRRLPSAGVCFKAFSVGDHNVRRPPLVRWIAFLDRIHVQEFDQDVRGIAGDFLHDAASYKDGNMWRHVLPSLYW
jgi:hypothetical protein